MAKHIFKKRFKLYKIEIFTWPYQQKAYNNLCWNVYGFAANCSFLIMLVLLCSMGQLYLPPFCVSTTWAWAGQNGGVPPYWDLLKMNAQGKIEWTQAENISVSSLNCIKNKQFILFTWAFTYLALTGTVCTLYSVHLENRSVYFLIMGKREGLTSFWKNIFVDSYMII